MRTKSRYCLMCEARETVADALGNPWCEAHTKRAELINWGQSHGWPRVDCTAKEETVNFAKNCFRYYSVGPDEDLWRDACIYGTDHFMDTLHGTIFAAEEDVA